MTLFKRGPMRVEPLQDLPSALSQIITLCSVVRVCMSISLIASFKGAKEAGLERITTAALKRYYQFGSPWEMHRTGFLLPPDFDTFSSRPNRAIATTCVNISVVFPAFRRIDTGIRWLAGSFNRNRSGLVARFEVRFTQ